MKEMNDIANTAQQNSSMVNIKNTSYTQILSTCTMQWQWYMETTDSLLVVIYKTLK
jgi:hypothetical protein